MWVDAADFTVFNERGDHLFDETCVTFLYKDYRRVGAERRLVMTLATNEFFPDLRLAQAANSAGCQRGFRLCSGGCAPCPQPLRSIWPFKLQP